MANGDDTRKAILAYINDYIKIHGYAPTVREIGEAVDLKSPSSVHSQMKTLFLKGCLETEAEFGSPRAFRVTEKGKRYDIS